MNKVLKTLRFRLAAWNALVVLLTSVVLLVGLRQGVRWTLLNEMDQILIEDAEEILIALKELPDHQLQILTDELERKAAGHKHHGWFVELADSKGHVVWSSLGVPQELKNIPFFSGGITPLPVTVHGYRFVERHTSSTTRLAVIRVGAEQDFLKTDMARLDRLLSLAALGVMLIAPLVGYWLARRAAKTLGDLIRTASRLRPSHLEERLPIQGTGDELDQLAHTVNDLLDRIAVYLQDKRDLLANAAHELRTPLAAIRSSVEVALADDRTISEYKDLLEDIIEEGTALETLVNQLLLLSETEADRLKTLTEPVPLHEVATRTLEMFEGVAEAKQVTLKRGEISQAFVPGHRSHLRQLLNNLLDNAIKYTPEGGEVQFSSKLENSHVVITVRETGIGIGKEDLPHIFDRFFRADRSRLRHGINGTGLGLSICQAVVTAHRGTIRCESEIDRGTTMTIELPTIPGDTCQN